MDIDGTICSEVHSRKYEEAKPYYAVIDFINKLYDDGHYIIYFTARGMGTCNGNVNEAYNKWYTITESQLKEWNVEYHELHLGKPWGDVYVDDKAFNIQNGNVEKLVDMVKISKDKHD